MDTLRIPSLFIQNEGEVSAKVALLLTAASQKFVVRFTGGCGFMSKEDAQNMDQMFAEAFTGYSGAMLFGGTRMVKKDHIKEVVPSITEVPGVIRQRCPTSRLIGVVPKTKDFRILPELGIVVDDNEGCDYLTIIHPNQDHCLAVQKSVDLEATWETEYEECIRIIQTLREFGEFHSLLVSYNGGGVTEKEILATAKLGWPILLINNSGRKTDEYANDQTFLQRYPNVRVAGKDVASIRRELERLGALRK